ncbi:hypothetical protein [Microbulbifer sp. JTAC008]|uniref:hypothetical protein n=1 Tax=unclassified Microbulbifer TaxID=2619833 RepID=UPI0040391D4D
MLPQEISGFFAVESLIARALACMNIQYFVGLRSFVNKVDGLYFLFGGCPEFVGIEFKSWRKKKGFKEKVAIEKIEP